MVVDAVPSGKSRENVAARVDHQVQRELGLQQAAVDSPGQVPRHPGQPVVGHDVQLHRLFLCFSCFACLASFVFVFVSFLFCMCLLCLLRFVLHCGACAFLCLPVAGASCVDLVVVACGRYLL